MPITKREPQERPDRHPDWGVISFTKVCRCGNPSGKTYRYKPGEHHEIKKEHWRCLNCGKVTDWEGRP